MVELPESSPLVDLRDGPSFEQEEQAKDREHKAWMQQREHEHQKAMAVAEHKHRAGMQKLVLGAVFAVLLIVFGLTLGAVWNHAVTPDFAIEISKFVLPSLVGSAATIVGAMFVSAGGKGS
ncbi:hypothetical protein AB0L41_21195 [Amycolatopsis mediterranei]|uniref:hypothetical protein n=1 Tax=Amycolatopsis mediterranei TaxID=33910 RepID=UPI00342AE890